jgi:crossover junction endodeoxyribonuclease RuvC
MRIIGVDPGSVCCGYGIVEVPNLRSQISDLRYITSGEIRMSRGSSLPERLRVLYCSLKKVIDEYKPDCLCLEKLFYHKSVTSAFTLGSIRGVVMLLAAEGGIPVHEYNPTKVKMALTGFGRAEKRQVNEMVKRLLNLTPSGLRLSKDATDALALCICHINNSLRDERFK